MITELNYKDLKYFSTELDIDNIKGSSEIVGQKDAAEALKFGLKVKNKGYNVYVAGNIGSGRTTFAERFAKEIASKEKTPNDMCYVYNFKNPSEPKLLKMEAGLAKELKKQMEEAMKKLLIEVPRAFESKKYGDEKNKIILENRRKKDAVLNELSAKAEENGYKVKSNGAGGVYFQPTLDGNPLTEEEYDNLSAVEKAAIELDADEVHVSASEAFDKLRKIDDDTQEELDREDYNLAIRIVGRFINPILAYFENYDNIVEYLNDVKEDVIDNISMFHDDKDASQDDSIAAIMPWIGKRSKNDFLFKYEVNVVVDNSNTKGAPVIVDYAPTYADLVGEIACESENNNLITDFTKIRAGLLHKANGGYIIFDVVDLLRNYFAWETLIKCLKTGEVRIEPLKEYQTNGYTVLGIQPEKCDLDVKVILVGNMYYYQLLCENEEEFSKLFKVCAMFDYEMDNNSDNERALIGMIKNFVNENGLKQLSADAIYRIIELAVRMAERKDKMTTSFGKLSDIVIEASALCENDKINAKDIDNAVKLRERRFGRYASKYQKMIVDDEIMIATEGSRVGQVNGLCVMELGDYTFGMPTRITASTYTGKAGIVNIEKEAEMSGAVHNKGMQVLVGYLGGKYAQKFPLTLSCRVCFEQSYSGVDGDSASSTETYAIISSLSELPINQEIAVTGSMNQFGEIQPIGGVIYKIEGFYDICKQRGLTGTQGVMIPRRNVNDLVLKDEVIEAVKDKKFHIYAVDTIDDGIEVLMGKPAGEKLKDESYPYGSVHHLVYEKLNKYYKMTLEE